MSKTQHTPGPWNINHGANYLPSVSSSVTHTKICDIAGQDDDAGIKDFQNESEANARLIAAAPELLEALKEADIDLNSNQIETARKRIKEAIKKATESADHKVN